MGGDDEDGSGRRTGQSKGPWNDRGYNVLALCIGLGAVFGAGVGSLLFDNTAIGIAFGIALGVAFSAAFGFGSSSSDEDDDDAGSGESGRPPDRG